MDDYDSFTNPTFFGIKILKTKLAHRNQMKSCLYSL